MMQIGISQKIRIKFGLSAIVIVFFTLCSVYRSANSLKKEPPELYENVKSRFRVPKGTKHFKITCPVKLEASDDSDGVIVKWSKDGEEIVDDDDWEQTRYKLLNKNRDLKMKSVQFEDQGRFTCMAVNGWGHKEMHFLLEVFDSVTDGSSISLSESTSAPIWKNREAIDETIKNGVRVKPGGRLELKCPASGNPLPRIIWMKNGRILQSSRYALDSTSAAAGVNQELLSPTSASFILEKTEKSDSGVYTCRLENNYGSLEAEFEVLVEKEPAFFMFSDERGLEMGTFGGAPIPGVPISQLPTPIIDQPQNMTVKAGHTAQFVCKVEWRKENSVIRWLRRIENPVLVKQRAPNSTILHVSNMHLLVIEQKSDAVKTISNDHNSKNLNKLTIANVQKEDSGRYFCVVTNAAGQFVYRSAYLQVVDVPSVFFWNGFQVQNVAVSVLIILILSMAAVSIVWLSCCNQSAGRKDMPILTKTCNAPTTTTLATNTSSSSSSDNNNNNKRSMNGNLNPPPPPPRLPLPEAPSLKGPIQYTLTGPSVVVPHTTGPQRRICNFPPNAPAQHSPMLWTMHQNSPVESATLGRPSAQYHQVAPTQPQHCASPPPLLHRTNRADDELSRISSHIYASGSPLPHAQDDFHSHPIGRTSFRHQALLYPLHHPRHQGNWMTSLPPPPSIARPTTPNYRHHHEIRSNNNNHWPTQGLVSPRPPHCTRTVRNTTYGRLSEEQRQRLISIEGAYT